MSNTKAPTNAFTPQNQPTPGNTRGKSAKTRSLAALKAVTGKSEDDLYEYIVDQAFHNSDKDMMELFLKTAVPTTRSKLPNTTFQYDRSLPYHEKCELIIEAVSKGELSPDEGSEIINQIKSTAAVYEQSELVARIEQLEAYALARQTKPAGDNE
ncbi:hypothetical protein AWB76_00935 [Caballeronia temeraria]|uniref:Uncharacterized protein n=1 Tax=Caballeronia temeraria TaxID=1777137 RepID=A0A157ZM52_9BURK|nr:hypothetical protein [Caballeronia temeraria]SAK46561.1 hypothetical protein AWB76_00935 [Caballeronia temeraria]